MRNHFMREYEDAFSPENWEVLRNRVKTYVRAHGDEMINILKEHDSPPPGGGRGGGRRGRGKGRR